MVSDIGAVPGLPWVMIPSCGQSEHLIPLVKELATSAVNVCVVINNTKDEIDLMLEVVGVGGYVYLWPGHARIYEMWNWAIKQAQLNNVASLSILNDDVYVTGEDLYKIDNELQNDSSLGIVGWDWQAVGGEGLKYVGGSLRKGGIGGFAFMLNPFRVGFVDERFEWWGGDDDLFNQTTSKGYRLALLRGTRVMHYTSTTASKITSVYDRCEQDRALLLSKWGDTW